MNAQPIRVLLIEDNPGDALLVRHLLAESASGAFAVAHADRLAAGLQRLAAGADVVLLDLVLPDREGLAALAAVRAAAPAVPVVVMTGLEDEALGLKSLQQGAQDYLVKGRFESAALARTIRYAIERERLEASLRAARGDLERRVRERTDELAQANEVLRQTEERLRLMLRQMPAILWTTDRDLRITFDAGAGLASLGLAPGDWLHRTLFEYLGTEDRTFLPLAAHYRALAGEAVHYQMEWQGVVFETHLEPLRDAAGQIVGCIGVTLDITARERAERERVELEARVQHAQQLGSLGALAGGLANDFNNLLTGILGNAELALRDLPTASPAREAVRQIAVAAARAADLTKLLLAHSGKGPVVAGQGEAVAPGGGQGGAAP
jgi:PAS domain S-box-containing protein